VIHVTESFGGPTAVTQHGWMCRCGASAAGFRTLGEARTAGDLHLAATNRYEPKVGDWVIYRPHGGEAEDGEVTAIRPHGLVMVRYRGDLHSKATRAVDLTPGGMG
jgi:hypothetical protein